jgi:hypothetical protein
MIIKEETIYLDDKVLVVTTFDNNEEVITEYFLEEYENLTEE